MNVQFVTANGHRGKVYPVLCAIIPYPHSNGLMKCLIQKRAPEYERAGRIPIGNIVYTMPGFDPNFWNYKHGGSKMYDWVWIGRRVVGNRWEEAYEDNEEAISQLESIENYY